MITIPTPIPTPTLPNGLNAILCSFTVRLASDVYTARLILTAAGQTADGKWMRSGEPRYCGRTADIADLAADPQLGTAFATFKTALLAEAGDGAMLQGATFNTTIDDSGAMNCFLSWSAKAADNSPHNGSATLTGENADATLGAAVFGLDSAVAAYCTAHGILQGA